MKQKLMKKTRRVNLSSLTPFTPFTSFTSKSFSQLSSTCLLAMVFVFYGGQHIALNAKDASALNFATKQEYKSENDYYQASGINKPSVHAGNLQFYGTNKDVVRVVPLTSSDVREKYDPKITDRNVYLLKSKVSDEGMLQSADIYDTNGNLVGSVPRTEGFLAISPTGTFAIVAEPTNYVPPDASGQFSIYDGHGQLLSQNKVFDFVGYPRFKFSESGDYVVVLLSGRRAKEHSPLRGGLAVLNSKGDVLGKYTAQGWIPNSGDIQADLNNVSPPIARFHKQQKLLIVEGYKENSFDATIYCFDLQAHLLWSLSRPTRELSGETMFIDDDANQLSVLDVGKEGSVLRSYNIQTGENVSAQSIPLIPFPGKQMKLSLVHMNKRTIINYANASGNSGTEAAGAMILDEKNLIVWRKDDVPSADLRIDFGSNNDLILHSQGKVSVGNLK